MNATLCCGGVLQADVCRVAPSSCVARRYTDTAEKQTRTDGEEREESPSAAAAGRQVTGAAGQH